MNESIHYWIFFGKLTYNPNHVTTILNLFFTLFNETLKPKSNFEKKAFNKKISFDANFSGHTVYLQCIWQPDTQSLNNIKLCIKENNSLFKNNNGCYLQRYICRMWVKTFLENNYWKLLTNFQEWSLHKICNFLGWGPVPKPNQQTTETINLRQVNRTFTGTTTATVNLNKKWLKTQKMTFEWYSLPLNRFVNLDSKWNLWGFYFHTDFGWYGNERWF